MSKHHAWWKIFVKTDSWILYEVLNLAIGKVSPDQALHNARFFSDVVLFALSPECRLIDAQDV